MSSLSLDLVIGVDLGTTGTAVAYASPHGTAVEHLKEWDQCSKAYDKVPSMVAFDGDHVYSWGFGVRNLKKTSIPNFATYKLFKLLFDSENDLEASEAQACVLTFLKELRKHIEESPDIKSHLPPNKTLKESKVKYIFSHPTTWSEETQVRFSDLIVKAGYPPVTGQLKMTSLDEAEASITHFFNDEPDKSLPKAEDHILVADIGGGTSDISIFKLEKVEGRNPGLRRITHSVGQHHGSAHIDEKFKTKLRSELIKLRQNPQKGVQPLDSRDLETWSDAAVLHVEQEDDYLFEKHNYKLEKTPQNGRLQKPPANFEMFFTGPSNSTADPWLVTRVPVSINQKDYFETAFSKQCFKIWEQCMQHLEKLPSGCTVEHIVLAGGFCRSPYVFANLSERFMKHPTTQNAKIIRIRDAPLAVCKGLVHDELRNIHGLQGWVYPAKYSYGVRKQGATDRTKWFLNYGESLKVPHASRITRNVDIHELYKDDSASFFELVKMAGPVPTMFARFGGNAAGNATVHSTSTGKEYEGLGDWIKKSLPDDLKAKFTSGKKITLEIKATMSRDGISFALRHGKRDLGLPLVVLQEWHRPPQEKAKRISSSKLRSWKFKMPTTEQMTAAALGVAIVSAIVGGLALRKDKPDPSTGDPKSAEEEENQKPSHGQQEASQPPTSIEVVIRNETDNGDVQKAVVTTTSEQHCEKQTN